MVLGGILCVYNGGIIGSGVVDFIEGFCVDYLIISIGVIEYDGILLEFDVNEVLVVRMMIKYVWNILLVVDYMKFVVFVVVLIGNVWNVRVFFIDVLFFNFFCQLLSEENVELVVVEQEVF